MLRNCIVTWAVLAVLGASPALADNWPSFRGPAGDGIAEGQSLPVQWGPEKNVAWTVDLPGRGWSAPVAWGDKVFVTTAVDGQAGLRCEVYCLGLDSGKLLWKQVAYEGPQRVPAHRSNTHASETPVTDGERVYAYFGMTGVYCYDLGGRLLWKRDLGVYPMQAGWGTSSSPALHGGLLFVQVDNEKQSFLVALDAKTGADRWRVGRDERSNWSTPLVWRNKVRTELVTGGNRRVRSYDPGTGKLLWELDAGGGRSSASAVGDAERLYVGNEERNKGGRDDGGGILFAVRAGASGNITPADGKSTSDGVAWSRPGAGPSMASPLVYKGYVYILDRKRGVVSCYAAETGAPAYERRRLGDGVFWASPWACGGKVFCLDDTGTTFVLEPGGELRVTAANSLEGQFWATPAVAGDALLLRGADRLHCIKQ